MIRGEKQLVEYENGHRVIWSGRAEIHYHQMKIRQKFDITHATHEEIKQLRDNPHNSELIANIMKRRVR